MPYEKDVDEIYRLHNCPNCGGTLQDDGACRFCGSKVYDFVGINLYDHSPSYIRMKLYGNIVTMCVRFHSLGLETSIDALPIGTLEFTVLGEIIIEDTKVTGGEY